MYDEDAAYWQRRAEELERERDQDRAAWAETVKSASIAEGMLAVGKELLRLRAVETALRTIAEGVLPGGAVKVLVPAHVQAYARGQLARAAASYIAITVWPDQYAAENFWPWDFDDFKPGDDVRNLTRAGALIAAEIDRLRRATPAPGEER